MFYDILALSLSPSIRDPAASKLAQMASSGCQSVRPSGRCITTLHRTIQQLSPPPSLCKRTHDPTEHSLPQLCFLVFTAIFLFYAFRLRLPIVQHVTITIFMFRTFRLQFPLILDSLSDDLLTYSDSKRGCQIANLREFVLWPFDSQNAAFKAVNGELFSQTDWRL